MVDVSVIIPVYNTGEYLEECLNSIVNQTLNDIEIICVDDGSTDNSLEILKNYENKDSRITVISQENKGQGNVRNNALSLSKGKYIYFMDSDDILNNNALKKCYDYCERLNLDFLIFKAINYEDTTGKYFESEYYNMNRLYKCVGDDVFSADSIDELIFGIAVSPCNKLYNREFILNTGARFHEGLIFEDNIFFWSYIFDAKRIYYLNECLYTRRVHNQSTMGSGSKKLVDSIEINNLIFDIFKERGLFERYKHILYNKKIDILAYRYRQIHNEYKQYFYEELSKDFNLICENEDYNNFIDCLTSRNKKFFFFVIDSADFREFNILTNNLFLKEDNYTLKKENKNLYKNIKDMQNKSNCILMSKSWKITKPLRGFKRLFRIH